MAWRILPTDEKHIIERVAKDIGKNQLKEKKRRTEYLERHREIIQVQMRQLYESEEKINQVESKIEDLLEWNGL